ncbi:hypothetical protein SALWKB12_1656 [Snodgrassella communis]|nr:hypothetical protein SALWKB12_1656 [Snodgrassella communis]
MHSLQILKCGWSLFNFDADFWLKFSEPDGIFPVYLNTICAGFKRWLGKKQ